MNIQSLIKKAGVEHVYVEEHHVGESVKDDIKLYTTESVAKIVQSALEEIADEVCGKWAKYHDGKRDIAEDMGDEKYIAAHGTANAAYSKAKADILAFAKQIGETE